MKIRLCTLIGSLAAAVFVALSSPSADAGVFLKFDGIDGEATEPNHGKWSDLLSFSYDIERDTSSGGGASLKFSNISCVKELDKASPKLAEALLTGQIIKTVQIDVTKTIDGKEEVYLKVELKNASINSNRVSVDTGVGEIGAEQLTFNYQEIKVTYSVYDSRGAVSETIEYEWDVVNGGAPGGGV